MTDYTIIDARGKIFIDSQESYTHRFSEQCRAGVQQKLREEHCRDVGELIEKIKGREFQEEIYKRQRLKALRSDKNGDKIQKHERLF